MERVGQVYMRHVNFVNCFVWRRKNGGWYISHRVIFVKEKVWHILQRFVSLCEERYGTHPAFVTLEVLFQIKILIGNERKSWKSTKMTHIVALCQAALWREIWHTSCRRFVSMPLKRGTATNAFPLPQNGPPTFTTCSIALHTQIHWQHSVLCVWWCVRILSIVYCVW